VALALGLLLGAAIASSEFVRTTQSDMVESMLSRYETLVDNNARLEEEAEADTLFMSALVDDWTKERLNGRTIVVMLSDNSSDISLNSYLTKTISQAGGSVVSITVHREDFGLGDQAIRLALQEIVEEVPGESFHQALAKQLIEEWCYQYSAISSEATQEDFDLDVHIYQQTAEQTDPALLDLDGGLEPATALQKQFFERYPLTRALLSLGVISISADYSYLQEQIDPVAPKDQMAAFHIATAWQLPYGVNGYVNGFLSTQDVSQDDVVLQSQMGIWIAVYAQEAALENKLQFAAWYWPSLPQAASVDAENPNYHVLLIQPNYTQHSMALLASTYDLSCVTTPQTIRGQYSVIALLSGAEAGIYGEDRSAENHFAPLPQDLTGRAAFKDSSNLIPDVADTMGL